MRIPFIAGNWKMYKTKKPYFEGECKYFIED